DEGSIKRAATHVKSLGGSLAIIDKRRTGNRVEQANFIGGPIEGKIAVMFDDMISTGGSICGAAHLVKKHGAEKIYIGATHGVLSGNALENIRNAPVDNILLTDTIPQKEDLFQNLKVLSVAPLLGEAIRRIHSNESVSRLFRDRDMPFWDGK
ncbi:MAG: ribose-phosphate diphosphokinase, partial [Planctomycetaceae bacterium]|nr:ribose-phosphate diphosphokinase [Planctomycetaceae bacterium]